MVLNAVTETKEAAVVLNAAIEMIEEAAVVLNAVTEMIEEAAVVLNEPKKKDAPLMHRQSMKVNSVYLSNSRKDAHLHSKIKKGGKKFPPFFCLFPQVLFIRLFHERAQSQLCTLLRFYKRCCYYCS